MPRPPSTQRRRGGHRRRRVAATTLAASVLLGATALFAATIPLSQSSAGALPPRCPDGSPPPCDTVPHPTTPTTVKPPISWTATIHVLDQSGGTGFDRRVTGSWGRAGSPSYTTPSGTAVWTDPAQTQGTIGLTQAYLPPGGLVGFRLLELTQPGRLCRSQPFATVPATGRLVHVLAAPASITSPATLSQIASGFEGRVSPDPDGAQVTISSATLVPQLGNALLLTIHGHLVKDLTFPLPDVDADFTYVDMVHLEPSTSIDNPSEVLTVSADQGVLSLIGNNWSDDVLIALNGSVEPDFRAAVASEATSAVNNNIAQLADVSWFRALGYVVSARRVTTDPTVGVTVLPSLCKVD